MDDNSSVCSSDLKTPRDSHLFSAQFNRADNSITLSTESDTLQNQHTFSSLEVELSASSQVTHRVHIDSKPAIPQRASQIFGFLVDRKMTPEERPSRLPMRKITPPPHTLSDVTSTNAQHPHTPSCDTQPPMFPSSQSVPTAVVELLHPTAHEESELLIMNHTGQSGRGPRGPRALTKIPSLPKSNPAQPQDMVPVVPETNDQDTSCRPTFGEKSNVDDRYPSFLGSTGENTGPSISSYTPRRTSRSKIVNLNADSQLPMLTWNSSSRHSCPSPSLSKNKLKAKSPPFTDTPHNKENDITSRLPQPKTPIRPLSFRPPHLQDPPSPVSSSELSPIGKEVMTNLRQQRMRARQKERQTGRLGSSHSRIRY